jgi:uncharacterized protein YkwD
VGRFVRPIFVSTIAIGALAVLSGAAAQGQSASCAGADDPVTSANVQQAQEAARCLINGERSAHGLAALGVPAALATAAQGHARDMVARQYFSHTSADGRTLLARLQQSGYVPADPSNWRAGEDIGCASAQLSTPRNMVNDWMQSPGHRAEILDTGYVDVGLGVAAGTTPQCPGSGGGTYVADFGQPPPAPQASTSAAPAAQPEDPAVEVAIPRQTISSISITCHRVRVRARASRKHRVRYKLVCKSARVARVSRTR